MNKEDRQKIYTLLSKYFPNARQLKDPATLTAWGLVLGKYPYDDVKNAVIEYVARNKFFPDIADITGSLTPEESTANLDLGPGRDRRELGPLELREKRMQDLLFERMREARARLLPLRRAAGIPATWPEAKAAGMTARQWWMACEAHGLNYDDAVFRRDTL